jgi:hypothetical protein
MIICGFNQVFWTAVPLEEIKPLYKCSVDGVNWYKCTPFGNTNSFCNNNTAGL